MAGESDARQTMFCEDVPKLIGCWFLERSTRTTKDPMAGLEVFEPERVSNYRRWWNNPPWAWWSSAASTRAAWASGVG